jgi:PAS domain S-box-containing protein
VLVAQPQQQVDVWGTPVWEGGQVSLQNATFNLIKADAAADPNGLTKNVKPDTLPLLTKAADLMSLTSEQASWKYPVQLRGVVMIYYPDRRQFFVHDGTAGFYISGPWNRSDLRLGDLVEVKGVSSPGGFAPMVIPSQVAPIGTAALPAPRRTTLFQMATGQYDSEWIEAYGVIRSYTYQDNLLRIKLTDSDGTLFAYIPTESVPTNLVDSIVRLRGVCTTHPNANRQISSLVVWSPTLDCIKVEESGVSDPAQVKAQSIASLSQFRPHNVLQRRAKIEGVVTLRPDGKTLFIQDQIAGLEVQTSVTNDGAKPGDRVFAVGYPTIGNYGVVLREAVILANGRGEIPAAKVITPENPVVSQLNNMRVQIDAHLRFKTRINGRDVLTLQVPGRIFEVDCLEALPENRSFAVGNLLRLTGIYRLIMDEARVPSAFQMVVPSAREIEMLERPSWWSLKHTLGVVGTLLIAVATTTLWILMLRRKVQQQTATLKNSETKFRSLVEQSLVGVYIIQGKRFSYVNPRFGEILGFTTEELLAMDSIDAVIAPQDRATVEDQIRQRLDGKITSAHYTFKALRKDGSTIQLEVLGSRSEYNDKPAVVGTALDVTARKRADDELFSSRQMLRTVLDTIPQRVFWKNADSVYVGGNKAFALDCGLNDPGELAGRTDFETHGAEIAAMYQAEDKEIMASGTPHLNRELFYTRPDGSHAWLKLSKVPLFDKHGKVNGVLGTYEDVTEHKQAEVAVAEASSLLDTLLDNSPDYIYFKDKQSRFTHVSRSLADLFKLDNPKELIGKTDFDFFMSDHARAAFDDEQKIIQTGEPIIAKSEREEHPDGRVTWALTTKLPWRDHSGNIIGTFGISKNVTALKEAERKLAHERGLFQALLENLPDSIYFKDRESRFVRLSKSKAERARLVFTNRFMEENPDGELPDYLGSPEAFNEFIIGKSDFDLYPEERARDAYWQEQNILETEEPLIGHIERHVHAENGAVVWHHTTKMPWRDENGKVIGTFGVTRDITELKEAEMVLDYERELFRTLLDHFPDSIYFKDLESRFVRVSRSKAETAMGIVCNQFGASNPGEPLPEHLQSVEAFSQYLVGKTDFDTYPEDRARSAYEDEQRIISTGEPLMAKVERTNYADGKTTWCITTKMPWRNKEGQMIGTFGLSKDITALKDAETKLESAHQRLVETSRLAGMAEVATDVLHNVGNVLNSVNISCSLTVDRIKSSKMLGISKVAALLEEHRGRLGEFFNSDPRGQQLPTYISALSEHLRDDQVALLKELEQLIKHIDHIKQIVAMQQSYAKVAGVRENITANQLVEDALHINAAALTRHEVRVQREFEDTPAISTEKHKVLQILVNLIRNAKYAMDDAKRPDKLMTIRIGTQGDDFVKIEVNDNGVGIPAENLTRIFGHGFTTRRNGHGFGLHSSAIAVRELGGSLQAHSEGTGKGATFTLLLPCCKPANQTQEKRYESVAT